MTKKRKKKNNHKSAIWLSILGVVLVIFIAGATWFYPVFATHPTHEGMLYVRPGMSQQQLIDTISAHYGNDYADKVKRLMAVRDIDTQRRIGAYKVTAQMNAYDLWRALASGIQTPIKFTFNNIRDIKEFSHRAAQQLSFESHEMLDILSDSTECAAYGFTPQTIPAMLISDTYEVYWNISPHHLLTKLKASYDNFWTSERIEKAKALKLTPVEVATLASIVDSETNYAPEKGIVARLYLNRIKKGMKLQSDPTAKFAVGDYSLRRITQQHTLIASPYNTYYVYGLPPGPISMPTKATLDAVLNAPENDYIYMCAKEDFSGSHNFAVDYKNHLNNARRYRQQLDQRGIY